MPLLEEPLVVMLEPFDEVLVEAPLPEEAVVLVAPPVPYAEPLLKRSSPTPPQAASRREEARTAGSCRRGGQDRRKEEGMHPWDSARGRRSSL